jgi:hypothetical protein
VESFLQKYSKLGREVLAFRTHAVPATVLTHFPENRAEKIGKVAAFFFGLISITATGARITTLRILCPIKTTGAVARLLVALPIGPEGVVFLPLILVRKYFVRFVNRFKFFLGFFVAGVYIGVIFAREFLILLFNFFFRGFFIYLQNFIIVFVFHGYVAFIY